MRDHVVCWSITCVTVLAVLIGVSVADASAQAKTGSIKGRVLLTGKAPGNPIIRMGLDPMCNKMNTGSRPIQEVVVTGAGGGLANVFVSLQGNFPQTAVPSTPVVIDQTKCIYHPRVIGARVGQTLQLKNSDPILHNLHAVSTHTNNFNVGQPSAGLVYQFKLKDEEIMLRLKCDIHNWMSAYIGVVKHPYFAVTPATGAFQIDKVPAGTYTIQIWHERYGVQTKSVTVKPGATTTLDLTYSGSESRKGAD
jgi:plastocyanin